jgi:hypothetical protein
MLAADMPANEEYPANATQFAPKDESVTTKDARGTNITQFLDSGAITQVQETRKRETCNPYPGVDLTSVLNRPIVIAAGNISSGVAIGTNVFMLNPMIKLLADNNISCKLNYFRYIKGTILATLRVNGSPFNYGRALFYWFPYMALKQDFAKYDTVNSASSFKHVQVNFSNAESVQLEIPFLAPTNFLEVSTTFPYYYLTYNYGNLICKIMNPLLNSTGETISISYVLHASFKELDYVGFSTIANTPPTYTPPEAQGPERPEKEAVEKSVKGVVAGVRESYPMVDAIMSTIEDIGKYVVPIASLLFSNPINQEATQPINIRSANISNSSGLDNSRILTLNPASKVAPGANLMGSDKDVMSIHKIISVPGLCATVNWQPSASYNQVLYTFPLFPRLTADYSISEVTYHTPLSFIASGFKFWRGSMRILIQIVASAFHSGRLRISYDPSPDTDITHLNQCINTIIDVRNTTDFAFTVPYLRASVWCKTFSDTDTLGNITISVVDPLASNTQAATLVYINVWVSGANDFQFAVPAPILPITSSLPEVIEAQGPTLEELRTKKYPPMIPAKSFIDVNSCFNDSPCTLSEVLRRPVYVRYYDGDLTNQYYVPFGELRKVIQDSPSAFTGTPMDYYGQIFAFKRGSVGVKILPVEVDSGTDHSVFGSMWFSSSTNDPKTGPSGANTEQLLVRGFSGQSITTNSFQPFEVLLPYFSDALFHPSDNTFNLFDHIYLAFEPGKYTKYILFEFAGDDFSYGYQIGAPTLYKSPAQ